MILKRTARARRRRSPRWALWCISLGALLAIVGGGSAVAIQATVGAATRTVAQQDLLGAGAAKKVKHVTITGAKNILLVGIDARKNALPTAGTRSDSIIL